MFFKYRPVYYFALASQLTVISGLKLDRLLFSSKKWPCVSKVQFYTKNGIELCK